MMWNKGMSLDVRRQNASPHYRFLTSPSPHMLGHPNSMRSTAGTTWGVQALLLAVADSLQAKFGAVDVQGELASFTRAASGHCYFSIKDADGGDAALRCVMFRKVASMLGFAPREGLKVRLRGRLAVYEARGDLQFVVESMALAGEGALHEQFLRLKAKLQAEGLFDSSRKRPLPTHPRRVAVVTSLAAAALHDVVTALARRAPHVEVVVVPTPVQGAQAPAMIVAALAQAARVDLARVRADAVLLVRGGESLEDLWAFNDEAVVRAVVACEVPVIVGVGHESDITLADLAADLRAPTPTAAAELAAPAWSDLQAELQSMARRAQRTMAHRLESHAARLDRAQMMASRPSKALEPQRRLLALLQARLLPSLRNRTLQGQAALERTQMILRDSVRTRLLRSRARLQAIEGQMQGLNPRQTLARGFAWLTDEGGQALTSVAQVNEGARVNAQLVDGRVSTQVLNVVPHSQAPKIGNDVLAARGQTRTKKDAS
jgi:exodeoxyribonuclease VII large subunit